MEHVSGCPIHVAVLLRETAHLPLFNTWVDLGWSMASLPGIASQPRIEFSLGKKPRFYSEVQECSKLCLSDAFENHVHAVLRKSRSYKETLKIFKSVIELAILVNPALGQILE